TDLLARSARVLPTAPHRLESLAEAALSTGFEAIAADSYEEAARLAPIARAASGKLDAPYYVYQADFLQEETTQVGEAYGRVKDQLTTLGKQPEAPRANS